MERPPIISHPNLIDELLMIGMKVSQEEKDLNNDNLDRSNILCP